MENLIFQVRNPRMVGPGYSTIPIPETHNTSVAFGKGPEPNTAYILWEKKNWDSNDSDGIEPNPTISSHKGWVMVAKCIFRGWDERGENTWVPNMSTLIKTKSTKDDGNAYTEEDLHEDIKFMREIRFSHGYERETNKMVNKFYWEKIINDNFGHEDLFYKDAKKTEKNLMSQLSKNTKSKNLEKVETDVQPLIMGYLGGRKKRRRTRRRRNKRRRKSRRKRKTRRRKNKKRRKTRKNRN